VLWLIDDNATTTANLRAHALKAGADVDRILFTPRASHEEYRAKLKMADVFLDTFPYNCGSTTNDVINAGVPLVTMSGRTMVSRMGFSIINSLIETKKIMTYSEYFQTILGINSSIKKIHRYKSNIKFNITNNIESFSKGKMSC
jgi:predicted O-linked N-acetylglucosamine transferase (SPINDLY family)